MTNLLPKFRITKTYIPYFVTKLVLVLLFMPFGSELHCQNLSFAASVTSEDHVSTTLNSYDGNLNSSAIINSYSGTLAAIGAYNGHLELQFPTTLPANTVSYLKLQTEDNVLDVLLGGDLGGVLSDVLGVLLVGNQELLVEAKNNNSVVLLGDSQFTNDFSGPRLKVVVDGNNNKYLMIKPSQPYNRVRLTNRIGSLIGLNNTKKIWFHDLFYYNPPADCGQATYTSYSGSGLTLDLLGVGGAGVQNPHYVIDSNPNTFSRLSLGVLATAAYIEQSVYFQGLTNSTDSFVLRLKIDPSLLALGAANNIQIILYNGVNQVQTYNLNSLLNLDALALLQGNQIASIPFSPNQPIDRVILRYNSLLNTQLTQSLDFYDITRTVKVPTIDINSQNAQICSGTTASLIAVADPTNLEIRWYDAATGGNLLGTSQSGQPFTTQILNATTTFYACAAKPSCNVESIRIPVQVTVIPSPQPSDISIAGNGAPICAVNAATLTPSSTLGTQFNWYLNNNYTQPITNGMNANGLSFSVNSSGVFSVTGLNTTNSPYTFYVSVTDSTTSCKNAQGNLKPVTVNVIDTAAPTTNDTTQEFCVVSNPTVAQLQTNESNPIWYNSATGGTALPATTALVNNGVYYATIMGANGCESSTRLMVTVTINDTATPTTNNATQVFCAVSNPTVAQLQTNESNPIWYNVPTGGTALPATTPLTDNGIYYAAIIGANGCESSTRLMVTVDINDTSAPTTNDTIQEFCVVSNPTVAQLQTNEPNAIWYTTATGGTALPATTPLVDNGVYYAALVGTNGCESSTRLMVTVDINDTPAPTTNDTTQEFCIASNPTVAQLQTNEPNAIWYTTATGGTALPSTTPLADNGIYYGTVIGTNGCESSTRVIITVDLNDTPTPTTNDTTQEFCVVSNPTVAQLQTNESNPIWYDVATGGTALASTTTLVDNGIYYATIMGANGCESSVRLMVTVDLNDTPAPTTNDIAQEFCIASNPTVAMLQTNEPNPIWYNVPTGGTALPATTPLTDNGIYYGALMGTDGCESSARLMVAVDLNDTPSPTTNDTTQEFCIASNPTVAMLQTNEPNAIWYDAATGGTVLPSTTPLADNGIYYGTVIGTNGCESSVRLIVTVDLDDSPAPTTNDTTQEFCITSNPTVAQIQTNESNVTWYDVPTGGTALPSNTLLTDNTVYYAALNGSNGCESSIRLMVTVDLDDAPTPTTNDATQEFCVSTNATIAQLQVNEPNVTWYDVPTGGTALPATTPLADNGVYYATLTAGPSSCESSVRLMITVDLIPNNNAAITASSDQVCLGSSVIYTTVSGMTNYQWNVQGGIILSGGGVNDSSVTVQCNSSTSLLINVSYDDSISCGGIATGTYQQTVGNCSDLTIDKTVSNENPIPDETIQFVITVTNNGTTNFSDIAVSENLPSGYTYVSSTATSGSYNITNGEWSIPTLGANETVTLTITVTVNQTGDHLNVATINSSVPADADLSNNSDDANTELTCFTIYNEFSPNQDGMNDYFEIGCIEYYPNNSIEIYNRYGNIVYKTNSYKNDWNGVANTSGVINKGEALPAGTYFYVLKIDDINFKKTGWIYIAK